MFSRYHKLTNQRHLLAPFKTAFHTTYPSTTFRYRAMSSGSNDHSSAGQDHKPLALPSTESAAGDDPTTIGVGSTVSMAALGPVVINVDGTMSRINNWAEMSEIEKENTLRVLGKRNRARREALLARQKAEEGQTKE